MNQKNEDLLLNIIAIIIFICFFYIIIPYFIIEDNLSSNSRRKIQNGWDKFIIFINRRLIYFKNKMVKFKCKVEDVPKTKTRKDFLREFFRTRPPSYYMNGKLQDKGKTHRSFSDLLILTQDRFKITSIQAIIRIVAQLNIEGKCDIVWCTQVNKFVVRGGMNNPGLPFITKYSQDYYKNKEGVDGISFNQLMVIREKENVK